MTARIESAAQLDELPVGTIISRTENGLDVDVAVKTRSGRWKSVWYTHPVRPNEIGAWVGADIMVRKASVAAELLASLNRRDAAEQRVQLVTERIGELEDVIGVHSPCTAAHAAGSPPSNTEQTCTNSTPATIPPKGATTHDRDRLLQRDPNPDCRPPRRHPCRRL